MKVRCLILILLSFSLVNGCSNSEEDKVRSASLLCLYTAEAIENESPRAQLAIRLGGEGASFKLPFEPEWYQSVADLSQEIISVDGYPPDPFARAEQEYSAILAVPRETRQVKVVGAPLKFAMISESEFVVLSHGPDQDVDFRSSRATQSWDQVLEISYDPTNGLLSGGDIITIGEF